MSSLFLFTGQNSFALREERKRWKDEFIRKHGQENLLSLDGSKADLRLLLDEIGTSPFGAEKRLVVIEGTPKFSKEEVALLVESQHPDCIVILIDPAPDKRTAGAKAFLAAATVKEFPPLAGKALTDWMKAYAQGRGSALAPTAVSLLLETVGEDQDMLARELEKLSEYRNGKEIDAAAVRDLAVPAGEREIWALSSLIAKGKGEEAIAFLRESAKRGSDAFSQWAMVLWFLRSIAGVHAAVSEGQKNPATIAQQSGVPFPTVRTLQEPASRIRKQNLSRLLSWAADADIALKTGGHRSSADAPEELQSLLEALVLKMAALFLG